MSLFEKASKKQAKLKLLIDGTSGSGKTHTMLRILRGIGGKIAVIDSENHSVEKKSNELLASIDVANIEDRTLDNYIKHIQAAEESGYDAIGIDSISHPWLELLDEVDKLARTKYAGNSFRAWSEGTPRQRKFVDAIMFSKCHIVATSRVKTEWAAETNDKGKVQPRKLGLAPEQGKGIEYEFDIWMRMSDENIGTILKDRFDAGLQGKIIEMPGEDFGRILLQYINEGTAHDVEINELFKKLGFNTQQRQSAWLKYPNPEVLLLNLRQYCKDKDKEKDKAPEKTAEKAA